MAVRSKRGIVLITTMISVVLVVMLVSSVVYSSMGGMRLSSAFAQREAALMAATSGAHYAMTRLQSDPTWVGAPDLDAEGKPAMPQLEGIEVSEYQGNVVGKLQTSDGRPLFFRIKFNYEDGEGGFDRLPNTTGSHIRSRFVSCNNLYRTSPTRIYAADADGRLERRRELDPKWGVERYQVAQLEYERSAYEVPKATAVLLVEGLAGNALQDLDISEVASLKEGEDFSAQGFNAQVTRRVIEIYLETDLQNADDVSVAYAAGNLELEGEELLTRAEGSARSANLFGARDVIFKVDRVQMQSGSTVQYGHDFQQLNRQGAAYQGTKVVTKRLDSEEQQDIKKISWDNIKQPEKNAPTLAAGYYVWKRVEGKNQLFYYPDEATYTAQKGSVDPQYYYKGSYGSPRREGQEPVDALYISPESASFTVQSGVRILADGDCKDFVLRYERLEGAPAVRPILGFDKDANSEAPPILTFGDDHGQRGGNLRLESAILGDGVLSATGDVIFHGPSILESTPGTGPSVYAMGDVEMKAIPREWLETIHPSENSSDDKDGDGYIKPGWSQFWAKIVETVYGESNVDAAIQLKYDGLYERFFKEVHEEIIADRDPILFMNSETTRQKYLEEAKVIFGTEIITKKHKLPNGMMLSVKVKPEDAPLLIYDALRLVISNEGSEGSYISDPDFVYGEKVESSSSALGLDKDSDTEAWDEVYDLVPPALRNEDYMCYKEEQLARLISNWGRVDYFDQDFSGVIYAQGRIKAEVGENSRLNLSGTMIAYGNDPLGKPGQGESSDPNLPPGSITISAAKLDLASNPDYLRGLEKQQSFIALKPLLYAIY